MRIKYKLIYIKCHLDPGLHVTYIYPILKSNTKGPITQ